MTDDTDELPGTRSPLRRRSTDRDGTPAIGSPTGSSPGPSPLSWPLVERRRSTRTPPGGIDRRAAHASSGSLVRTVIGAPLWPFRLAALAGALFRAAPGFTVRDWHIGVIAIAMATYTVIIWRRPIPYRDDPRVRTRIVVEQAANVAAILISGAWASPFVLFLVPTGMLAGFAAGSLYSAAISAGAVVVITVQHIPNAGVGPGLQDSALWAGLLGMVAGASGLTHLTAHESARQQQVALDRVSRLAEANSLLFSLQRVAQTLPASLDYDEVLDSTVGRLRTMVRHDTLAVYLVEPTTRRAVPARTSGLQHARAFHLDRLPEGLHAAVESPKTVRLDDITPGSGVTALARSGLYSALRARGVLVGMVAVECNEPGAFGQQQAEVVHGLSEPFGIAIDNARMFRRIRTLAADEERTRIARDLHDHVGSSLAVIGFEVDRALAVADEEGDITPVLRHLRSQVSAVVGEVRDTLYDLRTEVTDSRDLAATTAEFLQRVEQRSGISTHCDIRLPMRLPMTTERELWQVVREAILNAERHSGAEHLMVAARQQGALVTITVRDDGVGLDATTARPDSYGLLGMRERAHRLDADLSLSSLDSGGVELKLVFTNEGTPT